MRFVRIKRRKTIWCLPNYFQRSLMFFAKRSPIGIEKSSFRPWPCTLSAAKLCTGRVWICLFFRLNAYTISSGIFPKYLNGENIISVPLAENETMHIGYVLNENQELSEPGVCTAVLWDFCGLLCSTNLMCNFRIWG